jgi:hypothetical protein
MKPYALKDLYAAKKARRIRLANLSIDEKVDLIEQLHELGRTMVEARESLGKPAACRKNR